MSFYDQYSKILYKKCLEGDINEVQQSLENGKTDFNSGLRGACCGGHKNIALLMIEKGANDWNNGLYCACRHGHMDIALFMMEKGAKDYNDALWAAKLSGHKDLMLLMLKKGANKFNMLGKKLESKHVVYLLENGVPPEKFNKDFPRLFCKIKKFREQTQKCLQTMKNENENEKCMLNDLIDIVVEYSLF